MCVNVHYIYIHDLIFIYIIPHLNLYVTSYTLIFALTFFQKKFIHIHLHNVNFF
jgi:hypothetical protein